MGPIFFLIMINDFPKSLKDVDAILFADDTTPFLQGKNLPDIIEKDNADLTNVQSWLIASKLTVNAEKTKYMIFNAARQKLFILNDDPILQSKCIQRVNQIRFLGVLFDDKLSWKYHSQLVLSKTRKAFELFQKSIKTLISRAC